MDNALRAPARLSVLFAHTALSQTIFYKKYVSCNFMEAHIGTMHVNARVQKHPNALRMAGLRPVQIWVPDTRRPDFAEECRHQCLLVAQADSTDTAMHQFMDETLADVDGWTE